MQNKLLVITLITVLISSCTNTENITISDEDKIYVISNYHSNPENSGYFNTIKKWGELDPSLNYALIEPVINDLSSLYLNNIKKYWECVNVLSRMKIKNFDTQNFRNPIKDIIDKDDYDSFEKTVDLLPSLLRTPDSSWSGFYLTPLAYAVTNENEKWFNIIINYGVKVNEEQFLYSKGYESSYKINLLSVVTNEYIKEKLIKLGINQISDSSWDSYSISDNVQLHNTFSRTRKVVGTIGNGEQFKVIGHTYEFYTLPDGSKGRWVQILLNNRKYWIWSDYVWQYER